MQKYLEDHQYDQSSNPYSEGQNDQLSFDQIKEKYFALKGKPEDFDQFKDQNDKVIEICQSYDSLYHNVVKTVLKDIEIDELYPEKFMAVIC